MNEEEVTALVEESSDGSDGKETKQLKGVFYSIILVVPLTFCWYYASSKNAIATQQLVQTNERRYEFSFSWICFSVRFLYGYEKCSTKEWCVLNSNENADTMARKAFEWTEDFR